MVKFLDLKSQYHSIKNEIDSAISDVLESSVFVGGNKVKNFEAEFAGYLGAEYCVGVGNGTDALEIALEALGLPKGSEVLVPANSFIATSESVTRSGLKVVFCDVDPLTHTLCLNDLKAKVTANTKCVIAVHLYGHPCDMHEVLRVAKQFNLKVVEDCAQSHGAEYRGSRVGSIGDISAFSFYPGKNLGAYGDGGAIVTNSSDLAEKCRMIANHGRKEKYDHLFEGRNSRLDSIQAAILSVKLKHLESWTERRISIASRYCEGLKNIKGLDVPIKKEWARHVYHLFVVKTQRRDDLLEFLQANNIQSGIHYPKALPMLEAYSHLNSGDDNPVACMQSENLLSLPMGEHLSDGEVDFVISVVRAFFEATY